MKTAKDVPDIPHIPGISRKKLEALREAALSEMDKPPRIAVVGETGVGKSSTLNAMFNAGLQIDHVRACTKEAAELEIDISELEGAKGSIILYDMPGLGEDIHADEVHKITYHRVLKECDVALWVLDGHSRLFTHTQLALRDVVGVAMGDLARLVIGINKIDIIKPGTWNEKYNVPSAEQEDSIKVKVEDVMAKIGKICHMMTDRIIPYSASRWYRLEDLFGAMLDACPDERAWVLYSRGKLASYLKKVDPDVLKSLNKDGKE
jgi:predicted GTPase